MATITSRTFPVLHPWRTPLFPAAALSLSGARRYLPARPSEATFLRTYHSYEHDTPPPFTPAETAILSAASQHIPTHGFTTAALSRGAGDAGYLDASINLFPDGPFTLVYYHLVTQRLALAEYGSARSQAGGGIAENIKILAWKRLQANKPIEHRWQEVCLSICSQSPIPILNEFLPPFFPDHFPHIELLPPHPALQNLKSWHSPR